MHSTSNDLQQIQYILIFWMKCALIYLIDYQDNLSIWIPYCMYGIRIHNKPYWWTEGGCKSRFMDRSHQVKMSRKIHFCLNFQSRVSGCPLRPLIPDPEPRILSDGDPLDFFNLSGSGCNPSTTVPGAKNWRSRNNYVTLPLCSGHLPLSLHSQLGVQILCWRYHHFYLLRHLRGWDLPRLKLCYFIWESSDIYKVGCQVVTQLGGLIPVLWQQVPLRYKVCYKYPVMLY